MRATAFILTLGGKFQYLLDASLRCVPWEPCRASHAQRTVHPRAHGSLQSRPQPATAAGHHWPTAGAQLSADWWRRRNQRGRAEQDGLWLVGGRGERSAGCRADNGRQRESSVSSQQTAARTAPVHHSAVAFAVTSPRRLDSFTHCNTMQYCWKLQRSSAVSIHSTSVRIASLEHLVLGV